MDQSTGNTEKKQMSSMVSVLAKLEQSGFTTRFQAEANGLRSLSSGSIYQPHEVKIDHFYRFEGESNPSDSAIVYAIEANNGELGTLTDGYGIAGDSLISAFIGRVQEMHK
jgi:hypothetical protein